MSIAFTLCCIFCPFRRYLLLTSNSPEYAVCDMAMLRVTYGIAGGFGMGLVYALCLLYQAITY